MVTQPRWSRALALAAASTVLASLVVAIPALASADTAPASTATPTTVSSDALPTVQVNGVVWTQVVIGNTVYAGGDFSQAQPAGAPAGTGQIARTDLLAYNLSTGALIGSFAPTFDGQVRGLAASADGKRLYVVGDFTTVNGAAKNHLVALDPTTGATQIAFAAKTNAAAYAVAVSGSTVFVGGTFTSANDVTRTRAAAFDATTGALLGWAPAVADNVVRALVVSPDGGKVVLGGSFSSLNGSQKPGEGLGAVDAVTGANVPFGIANLVYDHGTKSAIYSLTSDGTNVYGTGYVYGSAQTDGNLEGSFSATWADGSITWIEDCHGDTYSVATMGDAVYTVSHAHYCGNVPDGFQQSQTSTSASIHQRALAYTKAATGALVPNNYGSSGTYSSFGGQPAPTMLTWYPDLDPGTYTGQAQAAWSVAAGNGYVVLGGEFPTVNGVRQTGLVRFATKAAAPNADGPLLTGGNWPVTAASLSAGTARVSFPANEDRDNANLSYAVYRNGGTTPVFTTTAKSLLWWARPQLGFTDSGLTAGSTVSYTVKATDPFGNSATSAATSVTVAATGAAAPTGSYANLVKADGAVDFWRLDDTNGATAYDSAGYNDLSLGAGVTPGPAGAIGGDTATTFSGASTAFGATAASTAAPNAFTEEAWFRTTSTTGGKIIGYGAARTGNSATNDRSLYMDASGAVYFGVYPGAIKTLKTQSGLNDGRWHLVTASLGAAGMALSLDGRSIGTDATVTNGQSFIGYWRVGGDSVSGWPGAGAADFTGDIDDVAIYPTALSASQVANHYAVGTAAASATTPTASFTSTVSGAAVSLDSSGSTDAGGTIVASGWTFGDGATAVGTTTQHGYAKAGSYPVTLTVTDSSGATASSSRTITIGAVNTPPTATFAATSSGRAATFNAAGSKDADGTISAYGWSFGDGATASGSTATHTYAAAGSYTATLTVTDNGGATSSVARSVTVANGTPVASFVKTVSGLTVSTDASASSDPDGVLSAYSWSFGDGTTATGVKVQHTYGAAGSYTVTLTVTDDSGATASASSSITTVAAASAVLGTDAFGRTVAGGLGTADSGGAWTLAGTASNFAVGDGVATITTAPGSTRSGYLSGVSSTSSDTTATFAMPALPAGGGAYAGLVGRRVGTDDYNARLGVSATGAVTVSVLVDGTALKTATVAGLTDAPGMQLRMRLQVFGSGPTTVQARVWQLGATEPTSWQVTTTDATAALQTAGAVGLRTFTGSGVTSGAVADTIDDFASQSIGSKAANAVPTAAFVATTANLVATVNGSTSADSDGTVSSYGWDFGDGGTATGATATHTYAAAGTYAVALTVTDDGGATGTVTQQVTVTAAASTALGADAFGRTVASGLGTADTGGSWTLSGTASNYAVGSGAATFSIAKGTTLAAYLAKVSSSSSDVSVTVGVRALPVGGSLFGGVVGRRVGSDDYNARVTVATDGTTRLELLHGSTSLKSVALTGVTATSGSAIHIRLRTTGTGTTTLQARAWLDGTTEPTGWAVTATDTTTALQTAGSVGLRAYAGSGVTSGPLSVGFDDFTAAAV